MWHSILHGGTKCWLSFPWRSSSDRSLAPLLVQKMRKEVAFVQPQGF